MHFQSARSSDAAASLNCALGRAARCGLHRGCIQARLAAFPDSGDASYLGQMTLLRFHCPECGFGDYEVEHLTSETEIHCVVCSEEEGRLIRLQRWEEDDRAQARFRLADAA